MDTSRDESSAEVRLFLDGLRVGLGTCRFNKVTPTKISPGPSQPVGTFPTLVCLDVNSLVQDVKMCCTCHAVLRMLMRCVPMD